MNPLRIVIAATIAVAALTACTKKPETPPVPKTSTAEPAPVRAG